MRLHSHIVDLLLALVTAPAPISTCPAQEVGSLDLTKIEARLDVRRPEGAIPMTFTGTLLTDPCDDSTDITGTLTTSLQLDGTRY
jgi:hypothetical protein